VRLERNSYGGTESLKEFSRGISLKHTFGDPRFFFAKKGGVPTKFSFGGKHIQSGFFKNPFLGREKKTREGNFLSCKKKL